MLLFLVTACGGMTRQLARDATPTAVETGLRTASSERSQRVLLDAIEPERVEEATEKLASGATDGFIRVLSEEERQERLSRAIAPMVNSMVDTAVHQALSDETLERVRALAKQATLGFQDAIDEVKAQKEQGALPTDQGNVLEAVNDVAESGDKTLYIVGAVATGLLGLLVVGTVWALRRKRQYEDEASSRDKKLEEIRRILAEEHGPSPSGGGSTREGPGTLEDPERFRQALRRLAEERTAQLQRLFKPSSGPAR